METTIAIITQKHIFLLQHGFTYFTRVCSAGMRKGWIYTVKQICQTAGAAVCLMLLNFQRAVALQTQDAAGLDLEDFENDGAGSWLQRGGALLSAVNKLANLEVSDCWDVAAASDFAISERITILGNE